MSPDKPTPQDAADRAESGAQAGRTAAEARAAEIREEVAITDQRRAEEEEAKAQAEREAAQKAEAEKERAVAEAEERRKAAAAESERAREQAARAAESAGPSARQGISGATVGSPGFGGDPASVAAAGDGARAGGTGTTPDDLKGKAEELASRPEVQIGAAFAGAFVFAQVLKKLGG